jgi:catalase
MALPARSEEASTAERTIDALSKAPTSLARQIDNGVNAFIRVDGVAVSDDPLIDARVQAYAVSFGRRSQ